MRLPEKQDIISLHLRLQVKSDADYVLLGMDYEVECEAGYSTSLSTARPMWGRCHPDGTWTLDAAPCLGMCLSEVVHEGVGRNTAELYQNYRDISVFTELRQGLQAVGTVVNVSVACQDNYSPSGDRAGELQLTCSVSNGTDLTGIYSQVGKTC